jgi:hypothetical protein
MNASKSALVGLAIVMVWSTSCGSSQTADTDELIEETAAMVADHDPPLFTQRPAAMV